MKKIGKICNGFSLISPKFSYKYDCNSKKYQLYKLKKGIKVSNVTVNNIENFEYIEDFGLFSEIDKKYLIEIFESEYNDWFVNRLNSLYKRKNGKYEGFNINEQIILKICMSFPETFYKLVNDKSICEKYTDKYKFIYGCESMGIGGEDEKLIGDFYKNVRCELYHLGSLGKGRNIDYETNSNNSGIDKVIYKKGGTIKCICLVKFISKIKESINDYVNKLKVDDKLYEIFKNKYVNDLNNYLK